MQRETRIHGAHHAVRNDTPTLKLKFITQVTLSPFWLYHFTVDDAYESPNFRLERERTAVILSRLIIRHMCGQSSWLRRDNTGVPLVIFDIQICLLVAFILISLR